MAHVLTKLQAGWDAAKAADNTPTDARPTLGRIVAGAGLLAAVLGLSPFLILVIRSVFG